MDVSRREKSSMMNKMIKKLSAVAIAAAMTLSTGVAAQAATLKVYFREWHQGTTSNTYLGTEDLTTFGTEPVLEVSGVESTITYKQALEKAAAQTKYNGKYSFVWDKDHAEYLSAIKIGNETWGIKGGNTEEEYDDNDKMIGAIWVGSAWSWYPGDKLTLKDTSSYPKTTLGETYLPVKSVGNDKEVVSMVLSYDETRFGWGTKADKTGTN